VVAALLQDGTLPADRLGDVLAAAPLRTGVVVREEDLGRFAATLALQLPIPGLFSGSGQA
jgi:hypothetical protein